MPKQQPYNYYKAVQKNDVANVQYNIIQRVKESRGVATDWEVAAAQEEARQEALKKDATPDFQVRLAPTINSSRPRAIKMAYSPSQEKLVIKFRGNKGYENEGPWISYENIPNEFWQDLKVSNSTGRYLKSSGIDDQPWDLFNPDEMPEEVRVLFNS